jgi:hypothetical protein
MIKNLSKKSLIILFSLILISSFLGLYIYLKTQNNFKENHNNNTNLSSQISSNSTFSKSEISSFSLASSNSPSSQSFSFSKNSPANSSRSDFIPNKATISVITNSNISEKLDMQNRGKWEDYKDTVMD